MLTAVVRLLRTELDGAGLRAWLDAIIAGLGIAAVTATFFLGPIVDAMEGDLLAGFVGVACPFGDVLILAVVAVGLALRGSSLTPRWALIAAGVVVDGLGAVLHLSQEAAGTYAAGDLLDLAWVGGAVLLALATLDRQTPARRRPSAARRCSSSPASLPPAR